MKKESALTIIKESVKSYFKNIKITLPFIFSLISTAIIFLLTFISTSSSYQNLQINPENSIFLLFAVLVLFLLLLFTTSFFTSSAIGLCSQIVNNKKIKNSLMIKYGKNNWKRFLGLTIILAIISIIVLYGLLNLGNVFVQNSGQVTQSITLAIILVIVTAILSFISLSPFILVLEDKRIIESIKESIKVVKKDYTKIFSLIIIFTIVEIALGFIQSFGQIINFLIIIPIQFIALTKFLKSRRNS